MATDRFEIRFGFARGLLSVLGTGPGRTELAIVGDDLVVKMGWAFHATIPLGTITRVHRDTPKWWLGIGVHGLFGTWQINGALEPMVTVEMEPPARARALSLLPVKLRRLHVSVTDPDQFVATVGGRIGGMGGSESG